MARWLCIHFAVAGNDRRVCVYEFGYNAAQLLDVCLTGTQHLSR
jgi:hypothetical protein